MYLIKKGLVIWAVLLLLPAVVLAQDPDPFEPDTIRVDSVATQPGIDVGVPVTCWNDENIGGYSLGFTWNSSDISVDSVSYIGSRVPPSNFTQTLIDNANRTVLEGMVDFSFVNPLVPGDGLIFTIWFNVPPGTPDQFVDIDSTFVPPAGTFTIAPAAGGSVTPQYLPGKIKIGDPQPPPVIVLSEDSFVFNAQVGGGNPTSQLQQITNGGGQTLNWEATWNESWLGVNPDQGTAPSTVVITANIAGLPPGTYQDVVTVTAPGATNSPQTFDVTLNLTVPPPTIEITPDSFYFQVLQDSAAPPPQDMSITNVGQGELNWTASESATWLDLSSYSGTAPSVVTLTVDNTGLVPNVYTTQIEVSDPNATNSPQYVPVVLEVFSAFPVIDPDPDSIFAVGSASTDPYDRLLLIRNNGGGVMDWTVTKTEPWLSFDIDTGSATQGDPGEVMLSFDGSLVTFGKHYDTVMITSGNALNSPVYVPVTFWKAENPQSLNVSLHSLFFNTVECGTYPPVQPKTFNVTAGVVSPPLNWTLTYSADWMTVTPTGAPGDHTVTVTVSEEGLGPGIYVDTIVVSSDVAINPPEEVIVTFTVNPSPANPDLAVNADTLAYVFRWTLVGATDKYLTVYAVGGGCVDWQATTTAPWLTAIPDTGTTAQEMIVRGDAVGLSIGRYEAEVIFTSSTAPNTPLTIPVVLWVYTMGDANGDAIVNITDVVYIITYIFAGGPAPIPLPFVGDVDCNHRTDISDVVYLIAWIFAGGPPPCVY